VSPLLLPVKIPRLPTGRTATDQRPLRPDQSRTKCQNAMLARDKSRTREDLGRVERLERGQHSLTVATGHNKQDPLPFEELVRRSPLVEQDSGTKSVGVGRDADQVQDRTPQPAEPERQTSRERNQSEQAPGNREVASEEFEVAKRERRKMHPRLEQADQGDGKDHSEEASRFGVGSDSRRQERRDRIQPHRQEDSGGQDQDPGRRRVESRLPVIQDFSGHPGEVQPDEVEVRESHRRFGVARERSEGPAEEEDRHLRRLHPDAQRRSEDPPEGHVHGVHTDRTEVDQTGRDQRGRPPHRHYQRPSSRPHQQRKSRVEAATGAGRAEEDQPEAAEGTRGQLEEFERAQGVQELPREVGGAGEDACGRRRSEVFEGGAGQDEAAAVSDRAGLSELEGEALARRE
jgi:hypothetical protein